MPPPIPAVPATYRLQVRLVDDRSLHDTSHRNRFAGLSFRLYWGGTDDSSALEVWEGFVGDRGEIARRPGPDWIDVDGSARFGVLDIGSMHDDVFTARISIPLQRVDPPSTNWPLMLERKELFRRLYNLGYAIVDDIRELVVALEHADHDDPPRVPWGETPSRDDSEDGRIKYGPLVDAIDRFVFRHHFTSLPLARDRYGAYRNAGQELIDGSRPQEWQHLIEDVRLLHDGS